MNKTDKKQRDLLQDLCISFIRMGMAIHIKENDEHALNPYDVSIYGYQRIWRFSDPDPGIILKQLSKLRETILSRVKTKANND